MNEKRYHRANINRIHNLVKAKVLVLLRCKDTWYTATELALFCNFRSNATMRSHCGLWAKKHVDEHGRIHEGILLRRARGLAWQHRPVWEYFISERGKKWLSWNVDKAGLLEIIMNELGLTRKPESIAAPGDLSDSEIKTIIQEHLKTKWRDTRQSDNSTESVPTLTDAQIQAAIQEGIRMGLSKRYRGSDDESAT